MFKLNLSSVVQTNKYMQYLTIITIVLVLLVISMIEPDSAKAESSTQITKVVYAHGGNDPVFNYFAQGKTVGLMDADETMRVVMDNYSEAKFEEKIEAIDERVKAEAIEKIVKENAEKLAKEKAEKERKEREEKWILILSFAIFSLFLLILLQKNRLTNLVSRTVFFLTAYPDLNHLNSYRFLNCHRHRNPVPEDSVPHGLHLPHHYNC